MVKVHDLAWLEFEKPDLARREPFAHAFGFATALRTARRAAPARHRRRGAVRARPPRPALAIRRPGVPRRRRRRRAPGSRTRPGAAHSSSGDARRYGGGPRDPAGNARRVVADTHELARAARAAATDVQRRPRADPGQRHPAAAARTGQGPAARHVVLQTTKYLQTLDWYLEHLGPDRQRLPLLPRPARARADDELHPLRPGRHADRPPHAGDDARPGTATCTRPTRSPTSTRSPPAASTCATGATSARGASAGISRAARSSTTGATRTGSWSSTTPTATCSTTRSSPAGHPWPPPAWPSGGRRPPRTSSASNPARHARRTARGRWAPCAQDNEFDFTACAALVKAAKS